MGKWRNTWRPIHFWVAEEPVFAFAAHDWLAESTGRLAGAQIIARFMAPKGAEYGAASTGATAAWPTKKRQRNANEPADPLEGRILSGPGASGSALLCSAGRLSVVSVHYRLLAPASASASASSQAQT